MGEFLETLKEIASKKYAEYRSNEQYKNFWNAYNACAVQLIQVLNTLNLANIVVPNCVEDVWAMGQSNAKQFIFKIDIINDDANTRLKILRSIERGWAALLGADIGEMRRRYHMELAGNYLIIHM